MKPANFIVGIAEAALILVLIQGDFHVARRGREAGGSAPVRQGLFRDVTRSAGLAFQYDNDASPARRFIETTGGGCAFLDYDNDGLLDIFVVQGGPAPGSPPRARPHHALYRNRGDGTFEDVTARVGLDVDTGYGQGVAVADYDNDGWPDLLITGYGGVHLFHNNHGHFEDVTRKEGLIEPGEPHWCTSAAWGDYDRDGYLDLFICHYASWFPDVERPCFDSEQQPMYCAPTTYAGDTCVLYHNDRKGGFTNVTAQAGLDHLTGRALGAVWLDYDGDGWPDLFVSNDMMPNWLLHNQRNGKFVNVAGEAGVANGPSGLPLSGMGIAVADFTGSLQEDLFVVNFSLQPRSYFLNDGSLFQWGSVWAGLGDSAQPFLAFGVESLDYDLDGHPDLVIGNGHINAVPAEDGGPPTRRQRQQLLHNLGDGRFREDRAAAGDLERPRVTRGLAVGDYDNDGRPDILMSGPEDPLTLFHNEGARDRHWIGFRLEGHRSNRDGIGARVLVRAGRTTQCRVVRSGSSYCSHSDIRPLFGLDQARVVNGVEVDWPSGRRQQIGNLAADRYYWIVEGGPCVPDPRVKRRTHHAKSRNPYPRLRADRWGLSRLYAEESARAQFVGSGGGHHPGVGGAGVPPAPGAVLQGLGQL